MLVLQTASMVISTLAMKTRCSCGWGNKRSSCWNEKTFTRFSSRHRRAVKKRKTPFFTSRGRLLDLGTTRLFARQTRRFAKSRVVQIYLFIYFVVIFCWGVGSISRVREKGVWPLDWNLAFGYKLWIMAFGSKISASGVLWPSSPNLPFVCYFLWPSGRNVASGINVAFGQYCQ